jgi:hypothetical protein
MAELNQVLKIKLRGTKTQNLSLKGKGKLKRATYRQNCVKVRPPLPTDISVELLVVGSVRQFLYYRDRSNNPRQKTSLHLPVYSKKTLITVFSINAPILRIDMSK